MTHIRKVKESEAQGAKVMKMKKKEGKKKKYFGGRDS